MPRKTYVYDKDSRKMVEKGDIAPESRAFFVIPDINEYRVVGPEAGKVITSRSKHREYLRRHNLVEVGDQKPKWMK